MAPHPGDEGLPLSRGLRQTSHISLARASHVAKSDISMEEMQEFPMSWGTANTWTVMQPTTTHSGWPAARAFCPDQVKPERC